MERDERAGMDNAVPHVMNTTTHLGMILMFGLAATALSGCAADAGGSDDDSEESAGFEAGEVTGTTADSSEQALTANGCYFQAKPKDWRNGSPPADRTLGVAEFSCSPARTITIGVCVDKLVDGRWTAEQCSGAQRVHAPSDETATLTSEREGWGNYGWVWGPGKFRIRTRVAGYGTAYSKTMELGAD
jgi:hypothetical protein